MKANAKNTVVVKDLTLKEPKIISTISYVGALIGHLNQGTVKNVHVQGGIVTSDGDFIGGLVG